MIKEQFEQHIRDTAKSQAQVAKAIGISGAALSSWLSGKYQGDNEAVERKVRKYLQRESKRKESLSIPVVKLSNYRRIRAALATAHEECEIAVITGAAGTGKTTAIRSYAQQNAAILIRAHRGLTMHRLMASIAALLGVEKVGGLADTCEAIIEKLAPLDTAVIIDEAEYLSDNSLELLRQVIYDSGESPLILVGLPRLAGIIRNMKNDHQQLLSRVGIALQLEPTPFADFCELMQQSWKGLSESVMQRIYEYSQNETKAGSNPSLRNCSKLLMRLHRRCKQENKQASAEMVDSVASLIMQRPQI
ncbi:MAG: AAA family ATPase [Spirochaetota bacterium]